MAGCWYLAVCTGTSVLLLHCHIYYHFILENWPASGRFSLFGSKPVEPFLCFAQTQPKLVCRQNLNTCARECIPGMQAASSTTLAASHIPWRTLVFHWFFFIFFLFALVGIRLFFLLILSFWKVSCFHTVLASKSPGLFLVGCFWLFMGHILDMFFSAWKFKRRKFSCLGIKCISEKWNIKEKEIDI